MQIKIKSGSCNDSANCKCNTIHIDEIVKRETKNALTNLNDKTINTLLSKSLSATIAYLLSCLISSSILSLLQDVRAVSVSVAKKKRINAVTVIIIAAVISLLSIVVPQS